MEVRGDAGELAAIVARVTRGDVHVDVRETCPLTDLTLVHEESMSGGIRGKVMLIHAAGAARKDLAGHLRTLRSADVRPRQSVNRRPLAMQDQRGQTRVSDGERMVGVEPMSG